MVTPEYVISVQDEYVLVDNPPDYVVAREDLASKLREVSARCSEAGLRKVLVRSTTVQFQLSMLDFYDTGVDVAKTRLRFAICIGVHNITARDETFLENVAVNRGGSLRFFQNETEALNWLDVSRGD